MKKRMQDKYEADPENYATTGVAARVGDLVGLQQLVWNGRPVDVFDNRGWSPIHDAAAGGFPGCLEFLLRQPSVDPDWQNHEKETAMLLAAREGNYQCLRALLNVQADVDLATNEGYTPLWEAIKCRSVESIRLLVKKGADVNVHVYNNYTPLHLAVEQGHANIVGYLLQHGAQQDVRAEQGLTPMFLACHLGRNDCLRVLLKNAKDDGNLSVVNVPAEDNATPLLIAAQEGHIDCVDLLLDHGADADIVVTETGAGPLQYAVFKGQTKCVLSLLPATNLSVFNNDFSDMHPLVQALQWPDTTIMRLLLEAGLDATRPRRLDREQVSELTMLAEGPLPGTRASLLCHIQKCWPLDGARLVLEAGVCPDAQQDDEIPALLVSMWRDHFALFCLLLEHGVTPNIYHQNVTGNVAMLVALHKDLEHSSVCSEDGAPPPVRDLINGNSNSVNSVHAAGGDNANSCWLEQRKHSYLWRLFAAGGELESLFQADSDLNSNSDRSLSGLRSVLVMMARYKVAAAGLALMLCLSTNITVPKSFLKLLADDDVAPVTQLADSTHTLAHMCRLKILRVVGSRGGYTQDTISSFNLPETLREYLLFSDLESYSRTLSKIMPTNNSS